MFTGDCVRTGIRVVVAVVLFAAAAAAFFFAFRAFKGKYFFRSEPTLKKVEIPLEKRALSDRKPVTSEPCREKLTQGQEEAYKTISEKIHRSESEKFWLYSADSDDFQIGLNAYLVDHPEVFWIDVESGYTYYEYDDSICVELKYSQTGDALEKERKALDEAVERVASGAPDNATDYDVELYLNDYLTDECDYDTDGGMKHTSYGALVDGRAVCDGYSHAFQLLSKRLGINCTVVEGTSEFNTDAEDGHMWNCIELGGKWYHIDVTWNDSTKAVCQVEHCFYINLTEEEISRDHKISGDYAHRSQDSGGFFNVFVPECVSGDLNYCKLNFVTIKDPENDDDILASMIAAARGGESYCAFLIDEGEDFAQLGKKITETYAASWIEGTNHFSGSKKISTEGKIVTYENKRVLAIQLEYE